MKHLINDNDDEVKVGDYVQLKSYDHIYITIYGRVAKIVKDVYHMHIQHPQDTINMRGELSSLPKYIFTSFTVVRPLHEIRKLGIEDMI